MKEAIIKRELFFKVEEYLTYLIGILLFTKFENLKLLMYFILLMVLLRKVIYGEPLDCGSDKLKKILIFFLIGGIFWSFLSNFNYRDSRVFFHTNKYIILVFFLYPIFQKKKEILNNFFIALGMSIVICSAFGIKEFNITTKIPSYRINIFNGILPTAITGFIGVISGLTFLINSKEKKTRIFAGIICLLSYIIITLAQTRSVFLALGCTIIILFGVLLYKNIKNYILILIMILLFGVTIKIMPTQVIERLKTTFNVERTTKNTSNSIRIDMMKIAKYRIVKEPIFGHGTYIRGENFEEYVENMPEITPNERNLKKIFENGFDESHNVYLNLIVYYGIFSIYYFGIMIFILLTICRNCRVKNKSLYNINLATGCSYLGFLIIGIFWPLLGESWTSFLFYTIMAIILSINGLLRAEDIQYQFSLEEGKK